MPSRVFELPAAHIADELDYGFDFQVFGTGDDVASVTFTPPSGVTAGSPSTSGQVVTIRLGPADAGTHRIEVHAVSDAGQEATIEADWTVSDPT
jgi:hypothetical protein